MRILCFISRELLYGGLSREEFRQIRKPVSEKNHRSLIAWSIISGLFWISSLYIYRAPVYAPAMKFFHIAIVICLITLICALFLVRHFSWLLYPAIYLLELSILGLGSGLSIVQPDKRVAAIMALAIIIPDLFIDRTISLIALEATSVTVYAVLGKNVIYPDIYSWGVKTLAIFSFAGIVCGHLINKARFERFVFADSAKKLADMQANYNTELEKEVAAKTKQVIALHDKLIIGMATMVESRDNSTGGHILRTSEGVRLLIKAIRDSGSMQLSDSFCEKIVKAAPMHDLGKIAVDDVILRKPGRFTPEEYDKMKVHAAEGARVIHEILRDTDDEEFRRIAENVAHYHHERMDGSGYPNGLKGDEIPLEARIMSIADVYDALVSKRVYKESYSFERADQIILEGMGTQFDTGLKEYYEAARPDLEAYYVRELSLGVSR